MLLSEYIDEYDNAPLDITDFAEGALSVQNCLELNEAANHFLTAKEHLEATLEKYNITIG